MIVTIVDITGNIVPIELDETSTIEDLKALIEVEMNIPFAQQVLLFDNKRLDDNKATLKTVNVKDGDMIQVQNNQISNFLSSLQNLGRNQNQGGQNFMGGFNPQDMVNQAYRREAEKIKQQFQSSPNDLNNLRHQNPELYEAIQNSDINVLVEHVKKFHEQKKAKQAAHLERLRKLEEDPFNPENQRLIEEEIRQKNIDENLDFAQEYTPEVFGSVTMLYVDAKINGHPIQAFVDSGAQSTIMSHVAAEKCGLSRLMDVRFAGTAVGVGTSRILGRIHSVNLQFGSQFFSCSITILEDDKIEFLLGLDMLKRHQCCIDLNKNKLTFHGGQLEIPFLGEGEVKKQFAGAAHQNLNTQNKSGTTGSQSKPSNASPGYSEEDIGKLTGLGFDRNSAINALKMCGGNVDLAASYLFQA